MCSETRQSTKHQMNIYRHNPQTFNKVMQMIYTSIMLAEQLKLNPAMYIRIHASFKLRDFELTNLPTDIYI